MPTLRRRLTLSPEQSHARRLILSFIHSNHSTLFVGGAAGTGKTRLLSEVVHDIPGAIVAAPTNLVARKLSQQTGLPASTLHHLLYRPVEDIWYDRFRRAHVTLCWQRIVNPYALSNKIVVVDECASVPDWIIGDCLELGARVVGFGDQHQLRPVNAEPFFDRPDIMLTELHRQSADSGIIRQAHRVLQGMPYKTDGEFEVVTHCAPHLDWADIVITLSHNTRQDVILQRREAAGIDRDDYPKCGEPLRCVATDHCHGVLCGELFTVAEDYQPGDPLLLTQPGGNLIEIARPHIENITPGMPARADTKFAFGYSITAHSAQGNEWERVLIIDESFGDFRRSWTYTAITRASKAVRIGRKL